MKIIFLNFLLFFFFQNVYSQISGKLATANGQPVAFANVTLLKASDTSFVKAGSTNEKGEYQIRNVLSGNYILRLTGVGYQVQDLRLSGTTEIVKDFGVIVMKEEVREMSEVVVRAAKPLVQQLPEGIVVNVESSILSKGSSVLQVLERSPGVVLDRRNNSIDLNGKSGVMVMMNGKPLRLPMEQVVGLLNGMSADDIEKIELLTAPPSKYDADGSAGIINIISKKNKKQGTNGSLSVTAGYGWGEKGTGNFNLSHNGSKINLYGSYTYSHDRTYSDLDIISSQNMPVLGGWMKVIVLDTTQRIQNNHNVTAGIDFKINSKTTVGGNFNYNTSHAALSTNTHRVYNILPDSMLFYDGLTSGVSRWRNLVASVYAEQERQPGEKISVNVDYLRFNNDNPSEVQGLFVNKNGNSAGNNDSLFSPQQKGFANTLINVAVMKADYARQLNKKTRLEVGVKGTYTTSSSLSGIESLVNGNWINRSETYNEILMKEAIGALYTTFTTQFNPSTSLVVGARYEYSYTNMDNPVTKENLVYRKLAVLFPSIFFSKKLNDNAELQMSYTKRISRPSYNDLASYVGYSDPSAVYTGNPFLKPTITHNIKLGYVFKGYSFSLLFSRDNHPIARYQLTQGPLANLLYVSPQNLAWQNNLTVQTNLPFRVNNWWNMSYGFVGGLRQFKVEHTLQPVEKTYFGYSLNFNQVFRLPKGFSAEFSGWYNAKSYNGSIKVGAMGNLSAGLKKELKNNGGSFQLSVSDFLRSMPINVYYGTLTPEVFSIENHVVVNIESRRSTLVKLTYSRSFGNKNFKSQKQRDRGSVDEQDRIRKE